MPELGLPVLPGADVGSVVSAGFARTCPEPMVVRAFRTFSPGRNRRTLELITERVE